MVLFINDRPVKFTTDHQVSRKNRKKAEVILPSSRKFRAIEEWEKHVVIPDAGKETLVKFFQQIKELKKFNFKSATFLVNDFNVVKNVLEKEYKLLDAAGGVILNQLGEVLMIYRLGKWDLPKGKAEKGETIRQTAQREVEEECSISVSLREKVFVSYHTYLHKNQRVLKRTFWYEMDLVSDELMKPQKEEDIEEIRWMNRSEMHKALKKSYRSIAHVLDNMLAQDLSFSKG
ncbi:NUDIX domain-containing protein [Marinilongibacter aquaticus]|uniref:NUDIX hydrolase n=1 Tax=Marinilongibacter aquaticus TaxID=2975157 RepID=UPI0021BD206A|nr:NUDIX domain-containing protein [Marinilongibacter aquaticus]UBM60265.1 NUDIX domain-containing protein [Marinilongibacter aquaticus]